MRSPRLSPLLLVAVALLLALGLTRAGELRERAEAGLGRGVPPREAALARGFVLGEDDEVDAGTAEDFRRAGLSHLLAVSGQNVTLLALLAMPLLAALGIGLRERLVWILALIVLYVPLAGAGPTIQRAAVMGGLGLLATLGGRRSSRLYALLIAAVATLAVDPGVAAEVGWQLSFAAVAGIFALAAPLRRALAARLGRGPARTALAEGIAVTVAATLATAPLIAFHFGTVSTTTLAANVLALPAVAPAMWLGMAAAAASQIPGAPVELLNVPAALLLAYVAQVAAWCAAPEWAELGARPGPLGLVAAYAALPLAVFALAAVSRARRLAAARSPSRGSLPPSGKKEPRDGRKGAALGCGLALALAVLVAGPGRGGDPTPPPAAGVRIVFLDVGQGDAILLQPAGADPVLVDGGPPGDDLAGRLERYGVERLGAVLVTHEQSDHAGGIGRLLGRLPVSRLLYARLGRGLRERARGAGVATVRVARGDALRAGQLRLQVLWPPRELLGATAGGEDQDPNRLALVVLARWHGLSVLLTADAEAEAVPLDPGPVAVLKVAHHGSEDAGLGELLERLRPRLAVISVGAGNPYGHPSPATLSTLERDRIRVLRTDRDGDVVLEAGAGRLAPPTGR
ncbi:MAG: ComEC/Rec2 family competence protein [Solirubrobacterales bacterium]